MDSRRLTGRIARRARRHIQIGLSGNLDDVINSRRSWTLRLQEGSEEFNGTSLSDVESYLTICRLAVDRAEVFNKFKGCREYRYVLEHVSRELGSQYLKVLQDDDWISGRLADLVGDDTGRPYRYTYPRFGRMSPTDFRYAKVASDLHALFGSLDGFEVAEIGVGYGGQCVVIDKLFDIEKYEMFDLPPVLDLALKYVGKRDVSTRVVKSTSDTSSANSHDLVISNYAFSELKKQIQEDYLVNVIEKSKRGYITYNDISPDDFKGMTAQEFAKRIPGAEIFQEIPTTSPENVLVVWGHDRSLTNSRFVKIK